MTITPDSGLILCTKDMLFEKKLLLEEALAQTYQLSLQLYNVANPEYQHLSFFRIIVEHRYWEMPILLSVSSYDKTLAHIECLFTNFIGSLLAYSV